jgi:hypothetical protein
LNKSSTKSLAAAEDRPVRRHIGGGGFMFKRQTSLKTAARPFKGHRSSIVFHLPPLDFFRGEKKK